MDLTVASARALSVSARSSSITLPCRTSLTPANPSDASAWPIALPWGSSTPDLSVMWTRAFIVSAPPLRSICPSPRRAGRGRDPARSAGRVRCASEARSFPPSTPTSPRSLCSHPLPPQARAERENLSRSWCRSLQRLRPLHVGRAALGEDAEPARHLLVALLDASQIL